MSKSFDGKVAIVTGAAQGLGRAYALALANAGARVMVNDLGGARDGTGGSADAAASVAEEIKSKGGEALANGASVASPDEAAAMVGDAMNAWGRVDILVNNAGILRDKSFMKMEIEDFRAVMDVHLMGSVHCTKAVWPIMREQSGGRIVFATSSSGLYGNFGQANYSAAKMALVGLMNTLHLEGRKYDIRVNCISPVAGTRMLQGLIPDDAMTLLSPESVAPGILYLVGEEAPSRRILAAGGGGFAAVRIFETEGIYLAPEERTAEAIFTARDQLIAEAGKQEFTEGGQQTVKFIQKAAQALGERERQS